MTISTSTSSTKKGMKQKLALAIAGATLALTSFGTTFTLSSQPASANGNCTRNKLSQIKKQYGSKYNYMIFNTAQGHSRSLKGVRRKNFFRCGGRKYQYWVFRSGSFTNKGNGGWVNWAFSGKYNRSGNDGQYLKFYRR